MVWEAKPPFLIVISALLKCHISCCNIHSFPHFKNWFQCCYLLMLFFFFKNKKKQKKNPRLLFVWKVMGQMIKMKSVTMMQKVTDSLFCQTFECICNKVLLEESLMFISVHFHQVGARLLQIRILTFHIRVFLDWSILVRSLIDQFALFDCQANELLISLKTNYFKRIIQLFEREIYDVLYNYLFQNIKFLLTR